MRHALFSVECELLSLLLDVSRRGRRTFRAAPVATLIFGISTLGFAVTGSYLLAVLLLVIGGAANLAAMSIGQTVVQLLAPPDKRGRVIGLYGMSANGLRLGSGITVGFVGGLIGVHWSLGLSSLALCLGTLVVVAYVRKGANHRAAHDRAAASGVDHSAARNT